MRQFLSTSCAAGRMAVCVCAVSMIAATDVGPIHTSSAMAATGHVQVIDIGFLQGDGCCARHRGPVINDHGQVAYRDPHRFVRGDSSGPVRVTEFQQPAPDGIGFLSAAHNVWPSIDNSGRIAFLHAVAIPGDGHHLAIFYGDETGLVRIARSRQDGPNGPGEDVGPFPFGLFVGEPASNDRGDVAFFAPATSGWRILRGDGTDLTSVFHKGEPTPDGDRVFDTLGSSYYEFEQPPAMNNAGQIAVRASLRNGAGAASGQGIFLGDGVTTIQIARTEQAAPNGIGQLSEFGRPAVNDLAQVAFVGAIQPDDGFQFGSAIFRGDGATLTQIARTGELVPGGDGEFSRELGLNVALNHGGEVAFWGEISEISGIQSDMYGIFRGDGTNLTQVARTGQDAPDGNGQLVLDYYESTSPRLNDAGQVAFASNLSGTSGGGQDDYGIFLHDDALGLLQVARTGDALLGSTIQELLFRGAEDPYATGSGMNRSGPTRLAYGFRLADGRQGVALWSLVPEPGSISLLAVAALALGISPRHYRARHSMPFQVRRS